MASHDQNMIVHLIAGGIAGTAGAVLTSPLEVMKVRFQADPRSYKKYSCASRSGVSVSAGSSSASSGGSSSSSSSSGSHLKSTSSCLHATSCPTSNITAAHHHHTSATTTKNGLKSYVNILLRNNHGNLNFELNHHPQSLNSSTFQFVERPTSSYAAQSTATHSSSFYGRGILLKFRSIVENEGFRALFKGLGPNIVGVVPYRAIYFFSYANSKSLLFNYMGEEGPILHIGSAFMAGFAAVTITNPIWFIKTRLQVDETRRGSTTMEVINKILKEKGPLGFYKGISASYFGITESALYFVIYEKLKSMSFANQDRCSDTLPITCYLTSAGFAKTLASCICYPHEVARTRLRLEGDKYRSFFQTLNLIIVEEGVRGIYKGMATHMIRQIPNTVIVMTTYELIINYWRSSAKKCDLLENGNSNYN